jgi:type IV secretory pathway VirB2 component (pilin)
MMGDDIDEVVVRVRADTAAFARDVATMRGELEGPLATGVARAGRVIESALGRAIMSGKFGFDDLKRVALRALGEIAAASLRALLAPQGQSGGGGAGLGAVVTSLVTGLLGSPGRATGGPVSAGRAYLVGERGPELFVPPGEGRIVGGGRGGRDVKVAIAINTPAPGDPQLLQKSSRQIARAVRSALRD